MVAGQFRCMGTTTHLKVKFGGGYMLTVRAEGDEGAVVAELISAQLPAAELVRAHLGRLMYKLAESVSIADTFDVLEGIRSQCVSMDYDVTQTTLEDVFLRLAEEAELNEGQAPTKSPMERIAAAAVDDLSAPQDV
mmetsp:Transcript_12141/g.29831  ORF Transcript_12141/g.29831 Transcript_12141/m.29831 type:complete len:136 (-) Transcript_12141:38-445(-)